MAEAIIAHSLIDSGSAVGAEKAFTTTTVDTITVSATSNLNGGRLYNTSSSSTRPGFLGGTMGVLFYNSSWQLVATYTPWPNFEAVINEYLLNPLKDISKYVIEVTIDNISVTDLLVSSTHQGSSHIYLTWNLLTTDDINNASNNRDTYYQIVSNKLAIPNAGPIITCTNLSNASFTPMSPINVSCDIITETGNGGLPRSLNSWRSLVAIKPGFVHNASMSSSVYSTVTYKSCTPTVSCRYTCKHTIIYKDYEV